MCYTSKPDLGRPRPISTTRVHIFACSRYLNPKPKAYLCPVPPDTSAAHTEEVSHCKAGSLGHCGRGHTRPGPWGMGQSLSLQGAASCDILAPASPDCPSPPQGAGPGTEPRADSVLSVTHGSHPCLGAAQGPLCWTFPTPPHCRLGPLHSCPVQTAGSLVAFPEAQAPCSPSHGSAKAPIKEPCIISIPLKSLQGS